MLIMGIASIGELSAKSAKLNIPQIKGATIDEEALTRDAVRDYGMVSSRTKNQSAALQAALDDMERRGGGNLLLPEGEYCFGEVYMRSNVQLRVSSKATLYPYRNDKTINVIMLNFARARKETKESDFIENCSVSCYDGDKYTVDYSDFAPSSSKEGLSKVRFAAARMVRNFTIADARMML